jgi:hypothetical protein
MAKVRKRLTRLLVPLLMLLLPLQGVAASYARLHMAMAMDSPAAATMPCHEQTAHHAAQSADHSAAQSTTKSLDQPAADTGMNSAAHESDAANHMCCHQVLSCTSVSVLNTPAQKFSDVSRLVLPLFTLFIPDSPDRPPRG